MSLGLITGVLLSTIVVLLWLLTRRPRGLPPGPPLLPLLGNLLSMDSDPRVTFGKLRKKYGDIFSVYLLHKPVIVLNGYNILREAFVKNGAIFSDRPHSYFTDQVGRGKGVINTSGPIWKEQRKFALTTLRDLGMGKSLLEDKIKEEVVEFLKAIDDEKGQPFDCRRILQNAVSNIICSTVFGKRFDYSDPLFKQFLKSLEENFASIGGSSLLNIMPILRHLPGDLLKQKTISRNLNMIINELIKPNIEQHLKQLDEFPDDFITSYIKEMQHRQQQGEETTMDSENLLVTIVDLFGAGTETTSTTLRWAIVYFLNYPDIQEKCFQEISENIGLNRLPSMKDKTSLPYLEATITEVLRRADIAPLSVPHTVSEDTQFHGYTIPKGVTVIPMIDSVLQDPDIWGDPENFRPERFLDTTRKFKKMEEFIPFSLGRRVCLGESLARMELLLFMASMIQRFKFVTSDGVKPSMDGIMGVTCFPKNFKVRAVRRD